MRRYQKALLALVASALCMSIVVFGRLAHAVDTEACLSSLYARIRAEGFITPDQYHGIGVYWQLLPKDEAHQKMSAFIIESAGTDIRPFRVYGKDLKTLVSFETRLDYYADSVGAEGNWYVVALYTDAACMVIEDDVTKVFFVIYNYHTKGGKVYVPHDPSEAHSATDTITRDNRLFVKAKERTS